MKSIIFISLSARNILSMKGLAQELSERGSKKGALKAVKSLKVSKDKAKKQTFLYTKKSLENISQKRATLWSYIWENCFLGSIQKCVSDFQMKLHWYSRFEWMPMTSCWVRIFMISLFHIIRRYSYYPHTIMLSLGELPTQNYGQSWDFFLDFDMIL